MFGFFAKGVLTILFHVFFLHAQSGCSKFSRIIPQLAEDLGLGVFDAFNVLGGQKLQLPGAMLADGVHMNQAKKPKFMVCDLGSEMI